ncbi:phosphohydrolase [Bradyrhizobium stylosanthis]|uniref:Phosphohydrolase n=1 Tax=Bradyrhizobium stylosanthis TaxID=1803665 RepID=A0A560CXE8_9BRAD|nr:phosphohydrolase [Bradyrhizobium stylosanthis]TWA89538.1 hypothetical protein FBZ96_1196 [Bradyrhizobium stylosanthis]
MRRGDWMQTYTGKQFWPTDPRAEDVEIRDIAHALSLMCRYNGHCLRFYSVAEHSVHIAEAAPPELKLAALLHDASEAYLADIIRPVKPFLENYSAIENRLMLMISKRFGFQWPMPDRLKQLDNAILADERDQIMATPPANWNLPEAPLGITLPCWSPAEAEIEFLHAFWKYTA